MARSTPPSLISYTEVAYTSKVTTLTSASVSWLAGDIIVVIVGASDTGITVGTPTATGLTFALQKSNTAANTCPGKIATAVAASSSSATISATISSATIESGMGVWVWRGSDAVGSSAEQHTTALTVDLGPTDTHSAYCWSVLGWTSSDALGALTPTPTTTQEASQQAGFWIVMSGNLNDQASGASTPFGKAGGGTIGPFTLLVQEIVGTGAAPDPVGPIVYTGVRVRYRDSI